MSLFEAINTYYNNNLEKILKTAFSVYRTPDVMVELFPGYNGRVTISEVEGIAEEELVAFFQGKATIDLQTVSTGLGPTLMMQTASLPRTSFGEFFTKPHSCNRFECTINVSLYTAESAATSNRRCKLTFNALKLPADDVAELMQDNPDILALQKGSEPGTCLVL